MIAYKLLLRLLIQRALIQFERTIAAQAGDDGAELVLFDDHRWFKRALPPIATVIYDDKVHLIR